MRRCVKFSLTAAFACAVLCSATAKERKRAGQPSDAEQPPPVFNVPIPPGHDARVVKLPYYDSSGKLQMIFEIGIAKRTDMYHLTMTHVNMETFDDAGKSDMKIDMKTSVLDLNTRIVVSKEPVTVRRSDFELWGETMKFNTLTRQGKMIGKVRMLIFNRESMTSDQSKTASKNE
jgi:lipopolysaccharide-assembly LptC-related protein